MSFGFFVALGGKSCPAPGGNLAGELKEPRALGLPQPFRAVWKLMQDTTEKQPRNAFIHRQEHFRLRDAWRVLEQKIIPAPGRALAS
jgi:hypothetical protein